MIFNTKANPSSGSILTTAGDKISEAKVIYRRTSETLPFSPDAVHIMPFTSIMMDKRAPGMFSNALSGPSAKLEWLAELLVSSGQVAATARLLLQHDLVAKVNERLLRGNARFKQGTVLMSHPALFRAMLDITGASNDRSDPKRITARVMTELFARIYTSFNVIMPYRSVYAQEAYARPVATTKDLIDASHVATVTETLEALKLGTAMKEREFAAGVVETILGPVLLNAANKLLAAEKYNRWMRDAASMVGMFLRNSNSQLLDALRDDGNLHILATNASFSLDAMSIYSATEVLSPVHEHRDILQYAALRLRELRRYETISMDKFANMYSYSGVKTSKGKTAGVFVARNLEMTCNAKAIVLEADADVLVPLNAYAIDPYVPMLNEFVNSAFSGSTAVNAAHAFAQHIIARENERDLTLTGGRIVGFNVTEDELRMLACAQADEIIVATHGPLVLAAPELSIFFGVRDGRVNYESGAYYNGTSIYTTEPGEVLILRGEDFEGNQRFTTRPQTYAEDVFGGLVDTMNPELYNSASRALSVSMPLPDGTDVDIELSLYGLLTGQAEKPDMDNYLAIDRQAADIIQAFFALSIVAYDDLSSQDDPTDKVMAEQVATGTHDLVSRFVKPVGFTRFLRTLNLQLMASPQFGSRDKRVLLTNMVSQHSLSIRLAVTLMLRMGLIPYGMQNDIVAMLTDSRAVERAATSEAFRSIMSARV